MPAKHTLRAVPSERFVEDVRDGLHKSMQRGGMPKLEADAGLWVETNG